MSTNQNKMIDYLLKNDNFIPINEICIKCNLSQRTVYNYLKNIEQNNNYILEKNKVGIKLKRKNIDKLTNKIPEDYEERKKWIFRKALMLQEKIDIENMLDYFLISDSTFHSDLLKIRKEVKRFHIRLICKDGFLYFVGSYHDLKKLTQYVIYNDTNKNRYLLSTEFLSDIFLNLDVIFIKKTIVETLSKNNRFMDEYSILNLLLHILISINQELNGIVPMNDSNCNQISNEVRIICKIIEDKYGFKFSNSSKNQFSLMLNTCTKNRELDFCENEIKNCETELIVNEIFKQLLDKYNIDLNVSMTKQTFILHIDNLLSRIKNGVILNNPLYRLIKINSPITYDLALYTARIINTYVDYHISESEVAYLALHIGTRIEQIKSEKSKLKTIVVCPEYYFLNTNIINIEQLFHDDLFILDICCSFDDLEKYGSIDLIITTAIPSIVINDLRILKISSFLNSEDRKNIAVAISDIKNFKKINRSKSIIRDLFDERLFFNGLQLDEKNSVIKYMANNLCSLNYVKSDYVDKVLLREDIASTDFNTIAIPHPAEYNATKTVISVAILRKPILWKRNYISLVFMLSINNSDIEIFEDVLSSLIKITNDNSNIKILLSSKTYDDFIEKLVCMLDTIENDVN